MKLSAVDKLCQNPDALVDMLIEKRICPEHYDGDCNNHTCARDAQTCRDCWHELKS